MAANLPEAAANISENPPLAIPASPYNVKPTTRKWVNVLGILLIIVGVASISLEAIILALDASIIGSVNLGISSGALNILAGVMSLVWLSRNNHTTVSLSICLSFASMMLSLLVLMFSSMSFYGSQLDGFNCSQECLWFGLECALAIINGFALVTSMIAGIIPCRQRQWNLLNHRRPVMVFSDDQAYAFRTVGRGVGLPRNYIQQNQPLINGPNIVYVDNQPFGYNQPHLLVNQPAVYQAPSYYDQQQAPVNEPSTDWEQPPPSYSPAFAKQLKQQQQ